MTIKVVAFNGSPRPKGNTYHSINIVLDTLAAEGIQGELVQLGGSGVSGCKALQVPSNKKQALRPDRRQMNIFIKSAGSGRNYYRFSGIFPAM